jgi:hypothetical protein
MRPLDCITTAVRSLVRRDDPATSHAAAARVGQRLSATQARVLTYLVAVGSRGLTDDELDNATPFDDLRPSTARKRRTELARMGLVAPAGIRDRQQVWVAVRPGSHPAATLTTTDHTGETR